MFMSRVDIPQSRMRNGQLPPFAPVILSDSRRPQMVQSIQETICGVIRIGAGMEAARAARRCFHAGRRPE
jgi:hypothetical protein